MKSIIAIECFTCPFVDNYDSCFFICIEGMCFKAVCIEVDGYCYYEDED